VGLFGSIFKGIGKAVGGIAKIGVGALKSGLVPLPFSGTAGRLIGGLLHAKSPLGHTTLKMRVGSPLLLRGKSGTPRVTVHGITRPTITALRRSPVLPGGALATRSGVAPRPLGGASPAGLLTAGGKRRKPRKRRSSSRSNSNSRSSTRKSGTRSRRKRRLKFGSPAWRKKYLGHGRKRRKRQAA
jgi:hypothetical protein